MFCFLLFCFILYCFVSEPGSLYVTLAGMYFVNQDGFNLRDLIASFSQVLRLKVCVIMHNLQGYVY